MLYFTYSVNVILSGLSTRRISFKQGTQYAYNGLSTRRISFKQGTQYAYNVTLRRVRETTVAVANQ
jgi:hypothetical protein